MSKVNHGLAPFPRCMGLYRAFGAILVALVILSPSTDNTQRTFVTYVGSQDFVFRMADAVGIIMDDDPEMFAWMVAHEVRIIHWPDSPYEIVMGYNSEARWIWIGRGVYADPADNADLIRSGVVRIWCDVELHCPAGLREVLARR